MKRIYTFFIVGLLMVMGLGKAQAQVVDVCAGNDTVELRLGNFQYGYVQWQVSDDNETWSNIDGAIDTVYRFLPDHPQYYRAEVRFPACSEYNYHSQVSYVQIPPKAFAGPDRTIPAGMMTRMNATHVDGAAGEWNIIEGAGGTLENPNDSHSGFIGVEGEYKLTWTVTNSCGFNTDTVTVKCVRTEYQENLVIVDETDAILSDSTQRLNGEYIISFNEPVPDIQVGSVLMGYMYPSFLRKVVSFEREGNLFTMQTEQGMLSDVIKAGVLNIDSYYFDTTNGKKPSVKYLERFPTRKEMQENPFLLRDGSVYVIKNDFKGNDSYDFEYEYGFDEDGCLSLKLLEIDFKNLLSELDGLKYWFEVKLYPHFDAEVSFDDDGSYLGARIGFYNAEVRLTQHIGLSKPLTTTLVNKTGYFNKTPIFLGGFLIGLVPTFITLDLPYLFKVQASIEPPMSFTQTASRFYTYEITQRGIGMPYVSLNAQGKPYKSVDYELPVGSLGAECNVGMMASVLVADVLGPYFEIRGNFDPSVCVSSATGDIGGNINMGVDLRLGCRFQLFSPNLTLCDWNSNIRLFDHNEPAPKKLFKYAGDNQIYTFGQYLETPVSVKVNGWFNTPMPWAYVHFMPENGGTVSESVVATNIHGLASTRWKPGKQYGADRLKVEVYDCNGRPTGETPQFFHAYTSATDPCINSNLTVEAYKVNESTIIPLVKGGKTPYKYSIDGVNYTDTAPEIHLQFGQTYCFYVMDDNGCEAMAYYNGPSYDCESTTLRLNTTVSGNSVMASAMFGLEPYQFFIDGKDYHASSPEFGGLPMHTFGDLFDGEYMVRVRDHLGCEQSQQITISRTGNLAISLSEIENYSGTACVLTPTSTLIDRGICWSTNHAPTVQDLRVSYGAGTGDFTFIITALDPDRTYYVRAYALDGSGTSYSREVCINPNQGSTLPLVASTGVTNVTTTSAYGSGNVTYDGGSEVTERGVCWGTGNNPTVAGSHLACGSGIGAFTGEITGLTPNMTYFVRAYATNSHGTAYGNEVEFITENGGGGTHEYVYLGLPSGLLWATCNVGANAPEEYGDYFIWDEMQQKEVYNWNTYRYCNGSYNTLNKYCNNPDYGYDGFDDNQTTLLPINDAAVCNLSENCRIPTQQEWQELCNNTTCTWTTQNGVNGYMFLASNGNSIFLPAAGGRREGEFYDVGSVGYYWSSSLHAFPAWAWMFYFDLESHYLHAVERDLGLSVRLVRSGLSQVTTSEVTSITSSTALCGGEVISDGGLTVTERGVCWSTGHNPTLDNQHSNASVGMGAFFVNVSGLIPFTTYYVRAYAINAAGTAYGDEVSFTTLSGEGEYVDLGLPSGTLWATCNVGANTPGASGTFFAWGETEGKPVNTYDWYTYKYCIGDPPRFTKYCFDSDVGYNGYTDNLTILEPMDDAATVNWGEEWRMPTKEDWEELMNNTSNTWDGGWLFTAPNGNSLFLPAAGCQWDDGHWGGGIYGRYWSSSLYLWSSSAWYFDFYENHTEGTMTADPRSRGLSVRAVRSASPSGSLPQVTTSEVTSFTSSTATCGGQVVSEGGTVVTERGVCWSTNHNPNLNDQHGSAGAGVGSFVVNVTGLAPSTTYYVRAYATNAAGTAYGNEVSFTTSGGGSGNHEYVDLGLPSGTLWATCNVGANAPEVYGDYFAWGETEPKDVYNEDTYTYSDNPTILPPEHDAATANWGAGWRMPTKEEWQELRDNTTSTWIIQNGVNGRLFTAQNGNSLFLPAAGYRYEGILDLVGEYGDYWLSSLYTGNPSHAWYFYFDFGSCDVDGSDRYYGHSVRAVREN